MSGTDYTTTPNLGLYKPNYALDVGRWGEHLNSNADVLDSAFGSSNNNAITHGADPTGVLDSTSAINAAASSASGGVYRNVYLPSGNYSVTDQLNIANGQILFGDGRGLTNISVTTTFNGSALGVIVMTGREGQSPSIQDLSITFTQPPDVVTSATAASPPGMNTITVASVANVMVGGSVTDATAGIIPALTTVLSISGNVVTLSANVVGTGVALGHVIHFNTSRALFKTLAAGATVGPGGTGCKYPPAIYSDTANRFKIRDVRIQGAWDGISAGKINPTGGFFLENLEVGSLNVGLFLDNAYDFGHLARYHFWAFGLGEGNIFSEVFSDGQTVSAEFGFLNGMEIDDFSTLFGYLHFNAAASEGWFHINKLACDQTQVRIEGAKWLQIDTVYIVRGVPEIAVHNDINVSGGFVQVGNLYATTNVGYPHVAVTGGSLAVYGGLIGNSSSWPGAPLATVTGGRLELYDIRLGGPIGMTQPIVSQTGASGVLIVHNCQFQPTGSGVGVAIATDNAAHSIQGNNFMGWTFTPPGPLGNYGLAGLPGSPSYANDTAAAAGGVKVGFPYRNGSAVMVRVT